MKSKTITEHKEHVHKVFTKIQDYGFKLKETKCDFFHGKNQIPGGHIIDEDGRRPDLEWATAIKDMSSPDNIASLQSFLELANYYQIFISNMHDSRATLNELFKKDKSWVWTTESQEAFEKNKEKNWRQTDFLPIIIQFGYYRGQRCEFV